MSSNFFSNVISKKDSFNLGVSSISKKHIKHYSYSSLDKIGKGFSSVVYKGINENTNQTIAIKAIDMKGIKDPISRQMLDCEIQALRTLKHHNVLKCFDVIQQTSFCYIITEYCNEGDLRAQLKNGKKYSESQTLHILKDIVRGFIQIGQNNFLHRDLKLANIFMNKGKAIIADFGFAKKNKRAMLKQSYNVGSPLYMSPEALKSNMYSLKNDIWSIGVMTYQLLHGQTPWDSKTQKELISKITKIPVRFRQSLNLSSSTKQFILKCLEVEESKRMSLSDLKQWIKLHNVSHKNQSEKQQIRKKSQNRAISKQKQPLSEVTNRMSSRSQKPAITTRNFENKQNKEIIIKSLDKQTIDNNNNILMLQINIFRLIYKSMQKLKKYNINENIIISMMGNQILKLVDTLWQFCNGIIKNKNINTMNHNIKNNNTMNNNNNNNNNISNNNTFIDIKQSELYLNQNINLNIKKYKSVIKQYYIKYHKQIEENQLKSHNNLYHLIYKFLINKINYITTINYDQLIMYYWLIELIRFNKNHNCNKKYLNTIIDCKFQQINNYEIKKKINQLTL